MLWIHLEVTYFIININVIGEVGKPFASDNVTFTLSAYVAVALGTTARARDL